MGFSSENISISLPAVELEAFDFGGAMQLPTLTLEARDADGFASWTIPALTLEAEMLRGVFYSASLTAPTITSSGQVLTGQAGSLNKTIPSLTFDGTMWQSTFGSSTLSVGSPTLLSTGLVGTLGSLEKEFLALSAAGTVVRGESWDTTITVPRLSLSGEIISSQSFDFSLELSALISSGLSLTGTIGALNKQLPKVSISSNFDSVFSALLGIPALTLSGAGGEVLLWNAGLTLPLLDLRAVGYSPGSLASAGDYEAWMINPLTGAHQTYTNFNVNSIADLDGAFFAAMDDGIYELTGTTDNTTAIDSKIHWVPSDYGTHFQKRCDSVYVTTRLGATYEVVLWADDTERRYLVRTKGIDPERMTQTRVLCPKGINARFWQTGFENVDGDDFVLYDLQALFSELSRRIR